MRVDLQPAFVLHCRDYRETSLLIEVFGRDAGRVGLVARGARRPKSPVRGLLQPFVPLLMSWSAGRDLGRLVSAELDGPVTALAGSALFSALYMNELLMRLLHRHDPHPELYPHYDRALTRLRESQPVEPVLRIFEKQLLRSVGYGLVLDHDIERGRAVEPDTTYCYVADLGPIETSDATCRGVRVRGRTLLSLEQERILDPVTAREAKCLMRYVLGTHLGERPLNARRLFREAGRSR